MGDIKDMTKPHIEHSHGSAIKVDTAVVPVQTNAAHRPEKAERHFCISVAGHAIGIDSEYSDVYSMCRNYLCQEEPEIEVSTNEEDILFEQDEIRNNSFGYLETLAVYRKICEALIPFDIFLMHGAVIATGNSAFMFTASSGTGKTTHIRKWLDRLEDAYVINGDKPLIRVTEDKAIACGTPWCGKEQMETNNMIPLKAIVFMQRGEGNEIEEITFQQAFPFVLQQTYRPDSTEKMKKTLQLISQLKEKVRFFRFIFNNMKADAFEVAYNALTGGKT